MGLAANPASWFLPFVAPIGMWVAWTDLSAMRIPNRAVLALLGVFGVVGALALPLDAYLVRWGQAALVLALGFVLSAAGGLGAGDAKFLAASAPFVPAPAAAAFVTLMAFVLAAAFVAHRAARHLGALRDRVPHWQSWRRADFPMGFALGPGLVGFLALLATGAIDP